MNITIRQPAARGSDEFSGVTPMQDTNPSPSSSNSHFAAEEWAIAQRFQYQFAPSIHLNGRRFCKVSRDVVAQGAPLGCDVEALDTGQIIAKLLTVTGDKESDSECREKLIQKLEAISKSSKSNKLTREKVANGLVEFLASPLTNEHSLALDTLIGIGFIDEKIKVEGCRKLLHHIDIDTSIGAMKHLKNLKGPEAYKLLLKIASSPEPSQELAPIIDTHIYYPKVIIEMAREELEKRPPEFVDPTDPKEHFEVGWYFYDKGDSRMANMYFNNAIKLAEVRLKSKKDEKSKSDYQYTKARCHYYLAACLYKAEKYEEALNQYKEAIKQLKQLDEIPITSENLLNNAEKWKSIIEGKLIDRALKEPHAKEKP